MNSKPSDQFSQPSKGTMFLIVIVTLSRHFQIEMGQGLGNPRQKGKTVMPFEDHEFIPRGKIAEPVFLQDSVDFIYHLLCLWHMLIDVIA